MTGTLYVVATPLGNLEDFSPRAGKALREADLVACEDTRHTRKLLTHFAIDVPTTSYHEHNEEAKTPVLLEKLRSGMQIALVSDAGTPLLSDPGFRLIQACRSEGIPVYPIPGPFAGAAAVSVSGLPTDRVLFGGFLSKRPGSRRKDLETLKSVQATLVFYLSPHRLVSVLQQIDEELGNREAFLIREMTKLHETSYTGTLEQIIDQVKSETPRGEYTLVVGPPAEEGPGGQQLDAAAYVAGLMQCHGMSQKDAVKKAAEELGLSKRDLYQASLGNRK